MPKSAHAKRRECRTARDAERRNSNQRYGNQRYGNQRYGNPRRRLPVAVCPYGVWHSAPSGMCAVRHMRRRAFAL
jgi:hypothetical protein